MSRLGCNRNVDIPVQHWLGNMVRVEKGEAIPESDRVV